MSEEIPAELLEGAVRRSRRSAAPSQRLIEYAQFSLDDFFTKPSGPQRSAAAAAAKKPKKDKDKDKAALRALEVLRGGAFRTVVSPSTNRSGAARADRARRARCCCC